MNDQELLAKLRREVQAIHDSVAPVRLSELSTQLDVRSSRPPLRGQGQQRALMGVAAGVITALGLGGLIAVNANGDDNPQPTNAQRAAEVSLPSLPVTSDAPTSVSDPPVASWEAPPATSSVEPSESPLWVDVDLSDGRTAVQRLLGVPADPAESTAWFADRREGALVECMTDRGFTYVGSPFSETQRDDFVDPNDVLVNAMSPEMRADYIDALVGSDDSCDRLASRRLSALAGLEDEYEQVFLEMTQDPAYIRAKTDYEQCLSDLGIEPATSAEPTSLQSCGVESGLDVQSLVAADRAEQVLINSQSDHFEAFIEQLPIPVV